MTEVTGNGRRSRLCCCGPGPRDKSGVMRLSAFVLLMSLSVGSSVVSVAQSDAVNPGGQEQVRVSVFITDAHGNPHTAVSDNDLSIEDNHKPPIRVISITHEDSPLRLGVLIDKSTSQRKSEMYKSAVEDLNEFLRRVLPRDVDKVFIETFDSAPDQPTPWMSADDVQKASFTLQPGGATALYDAVVFACKERFGADSASARRVLLMLSDGEDNQSHATPQAAIEAAQRAQVAIIAISTEDIQTLRGSNTLRNLAEGTGGYAFPRSRPKGLSEYFSQSANLLNSMFQVAYVPAQPLAPGKAHVLQIKPASG